MTKLRLLLILFISSIFFTGCSFAKNHNDTISADPPAGMVLFYKDTCPHCKDVESFIKQYQIDTKLQYDQKEVSSDTTNISMLSAAAKKCNIRVTEIGVPFFWDGSKCYVGYDEIISFFKSKTGI
jgi:glutaredoxin